ncbi:MAG: hypothetical protein R2694_14130 [Ilumatobacteraceae bacterium]|nr:hypothetical protein [Ilumatobacter sp.]
MGLLAYDPDQLAHLRLAMRDALTELEGTVNWSLDAQVAMVTVREARRRLAEHWLPLVERLLATDPLAGRALAAAGLDDVRNSLTHVMHDGYGWAVQADPRADDPTVVTAEEARALGAMLSQGDLDELLADPAAFNWAAAQLEWIAQDPRLTAEFMANCDDLARVVDALALRRMELDAPTASGPITPGQIDLVIGGLAAVWNTHVGGHDANTATDAALDPAVVLPDPGAMSPYAQAVFLRAMDLDAATFASVAVEILERWLMAEGGSGAPDAFRPGPNAADLLFARLVEDPAAAAAFAVLAADEPAILFATAEDPALAQQVALLGTSPEALATADAEAPVTAFVEWFQRNTPYLSTADPTYPSGWQPFLVDLIAPWTLQFTGLATWQFPWTAPEDLLAFVIAQPGAAERLTADAELVAAGAAGQLSELGRLEPILVATYLGLLSQLIVERDVAGEEQRAARWAATLTVLNALVDVVTVPAGTATSVAMIAGGPTIDAVIAHWEPDPAAVRAAAEADSLAAQTVLAAGMANGLHAAWVSAGSLPPGTLPPPQPNPDADDPAAEYLHDFTEWLLALDRAGCADLADEAQRFVYMILNPWDGGEDMAD